MRLIAISAASAIAVALGACTANDTAIFHKIDPPGTRLSSTVVDAKQRFLIAVDRGKERKFCAEPSPDALSAISSSFATALSVGVFGQGEGSGSLAASLSEAVSQLGTRNATIQLLRDGFYRLCEGNLNGSTAGSTYALLATKYVDSMVTLLAIEQLTPSNVEQLRITTGGKSKVTVKSSAGGSGSPQGSPQGTPLNNPAPKVLEPEKSTGAAPTPPIRELTLASLELPRLIAYDLAAAETVPPDAAPPILPVTSDPAVTPPENTTGSPPDTSDEEPNAAADAPEENQADTPDIEIDPTGEANADAPSVGTKVSQGKSSPPSVEVTNTVAYIVRDYLLRARFNDCLLALDNLHLDLSPEPIFDSDGIKIGETKANKNYNLASEALITSCQDVIKSQTSSDTVILKLLHLNSLRAGSAKDPAAFSEKTK